MGDGGQGKPDDRRDPLALTEGHDETTNGLSVLDELEDGPLGGIRRLLTRCPADVQIRRSRCLPVEAAGTHRAQRTPRWSGGAEEA